MSPHLSPEAGFQARESDPRGLSSRVAGAVLAIALASLLVGCGAAVASDGDATATATPGPVYGAQILEGEGTVDPVALYVAAGNGRCARRSSGRLAAAATWASTSRGSDRSSYVSRLGFTGSDSTTECATILGDPGRFWVDVYSCATWRVEVRAVALASRAERDGTWAGIGSRPAAKPRRLPRLR
jgi:hypothetical protein